MKMRKRIAAFTLGLMLVIAMAYSPIPAQAASTQDVYRLYNPFTGEHFYTASAAEEIYLNNHDWKYEGIAFRTATSGSPVYRVYNPNAQGGDHYYTRNHGEAQYLVSLGWSWDNNGEAVFYSSGDTPLYVAYNPNANSGTHNYTTSQGEQNVLLANGWTFGEVAWNVAGPGNSAAGNPNTELPYYAPLPVDENEEGWGTRRLLYANKPFDGAANLGTPTTKVEADVVITGDSAYDALLGINGTAGSNSGQFGIALKYDAGTGAFGNRMDGFLVAITYDFSSDKGFNDQFYSYSSKISMTPGTTIHLEVEYYEAAQIGQTYITVPGGARTLVGQYHYTANVSGGSPYIIVPDAKAGKATNGTQGTVDCRYTNIAVYRNGAQQRIDGDTWYGFSISNNTDRDTMAMTWDKTTMTMRGQGNGAYNGLFY